MLKNFKQVAQITELIPFMLVLFTYLPYILCRSHPSLELERIKNVGLTKRTVELIPKLLARFQRYFIAAIGFEDELKFNCGSCVH